MAVVLKFFESFIRLIQFLCCALILGIYSWYLATNHHRDNDIPTWEKAVEGISGAGVVWTFFGTLLTCFLGGVGLFAIIGFLLDIAFCGAFIYVAYENTRGASPGSCNAVIIETPIGTGTPNSKQNYDIGSFKTACKLEKAAFIVAIIVAFLFLCSALFQIVLMKSHRKEKAYGPSPSNNYTSGRGFAGWRASRAAKKNHRNNRDAEMAGGLAPANRHSVETGLSGNTMAPQDHGYVSSYERNATLKPVGGQEYAPPTGHAPNTHHAGNTNF